MLAVILSICNSQIISLLTVEEYCSMNITATHCHPLQHTATNCNTLPHTATYCHTLPHTATHCSTLPHTMPQTTQPRIIHHNVQNDLIIIGSLCTALPCTPLKNALQRAEHCAILCNTRATWLNNHQFSVHSLTVHTPQKHVATC